MLRPDIRTSTEYPRYFPIICPKCGERTRLNFEALEERDGSVWQAGSCGTCGARWYEIYEAYGFEILDSDGEVIESIPIRCLDP